MVKPAATGEIIASSGYSRYSKASAETFGITSFGPLKILMAERKAINKFNIS